MVSVRISLLTLLPPRARKTLSRHGLGRLPQFKRRPAPSIPSRQIQQSFFNSSNSLFLHRTLSPPLFQPFQHIGLCRQSKSAFLSGITSLQGKSLSRLQEVVTNHPDFFDKQRLARRSMEPKSKNRPYSSKRQPPPKSLSSKSFQLSSLRKALWNIQRELHAADFFSSSSKIWRETWTRPHRFPVSHAWYYFESWTQACVMTEKEETSGAVMMMHLFEKDGTEANCVKEKSLKSK